MSTLGMSCGRMGFKHVVSPSVPAVPLIAGSLVTHRPCPAQPAPHSLAQHARQWQGCSQRLFAFERDLDGGDQLASEFAAHINQLSLKAPLQHRMPSPLDPPTAAVAAQMDALQINDWPEPDAGVYTALAFAKPYQCEELVSAVTVVAAGESAPLPKPQFNKHRRGSTGSRSPEPGDVTSQGGSSTTSRTSTTSTNGSTNGSSSSNGSSNGSGHDSASSSSSGSSSTSADGGSPASAAEPRVRSWSAREAWLTPCEFAAELHSPTYAPLLGCDSWRACSHMVFPPTRVGQRAVQAIEVLSSKAADDTTTSSSTSSSASGSSGSNGGSQSSSLKRYTYTFVLERIASGPYKACWMTVGVRPGNYAV